MNQKEMGRKIRDGNGIERREKKWTKLERKEKRRNNNIGSGKELGEKEG